MSFTEAFTNHPGFKLLVGNRLELLADSLAELLSLPNTNPKTSPLEPELIVVQSQGMKRWLSMALADRLGICANVKFPFPNDFIDRLAMALAADGKTLQNIRAENETEDPWQPDALCFRVLKIIEEKSFQKPEFKLLGFYLDRRNSALKRYQLADAIARIFDQYQVFRPEMLMRWQKNRPGQQEHESWQAAIWQLLVNSTPICHRARRQADLLQRLMDQKELTNLPARVAAFGISYLPPFYLEVFKALATIIPVYFFVLNPCRGFWADIMSPRQQQRLKKLYHPQDQADLHLFTGNRLLALWGSMGRTFFGQVSGLDAIQTELFQDPGQGSVLEIIQQDILNLSEGQAEEPKKTIPIDKDRSIQVHVCHSIMRELEILHDNLTGLLDRDSKLTCEDILVMTPALDEYVPYIHAVFGQASDNRPQLPYTVADRKNIQDDAGVKAFFRILDLANSRMEASRIMEILESDLIRARFGLDHEAKELCRKWIAEAGIRWAIDADDRRNYGFDPDETNTWVWGLDRLILGSVMGPAPEPAAGLMPCAMAEGNQSVNLGRLVELFDALATARNELARKHDGRRWFEILNAVLDRFFGQQDSPEGNLAGLRHAISHLKQCLVTAKYDRELPLEVVKYFLERRLASAPSSSGFLSGGITFCNMLPLRSIPADMICLLGMDQDNFPRTYQHHGFDLIASKPQPGDRNRRLDDMYLFLESLLSARKVFYISYVGRSIRDDTSIPPSVVITQLLEYLASRFSKPAEHWTTVHRLYGFAADYYNGRNPDMFSYSIQDFNACTTASGPKTKLKPMLREYRLPPPSAKWKSLTLQQFEEFLSHPCRFMLQNRLGIKFPKPRDTIQNKENFTLQGLERYKLAQQVLEGRLRSIDHPLLVNIIKALGVLPHGCLASTVYNDLAAMADDFIENLNMVTGSISPHARQFSIECDGYKIAGKLETIHGKIQITYRFAKLKARDLLTAFLRHLLFLATEQVAADKSSILIGQDGIWSWPFIPGHKQILTTYLNLYWKGIGGPLPIVPEAAAEYVRSTFEKGKERALALEAARKKFGGQYLPDKRMVAKDPYLDFCFGPRIELDGEFEQIADTIFQPVFKYRERIDPVSK